MSYDELNNKANQLARYLKGLKLPENALIGAFMAHSPDFIVTILACLKAGIVFMPIDPSSDNSPERLLTFVKLTQCQWILSHSLLQDHQAYSLFRQQGREVISIDDKTIERELAQESTGNIPLPNPNQLAYVYSSSGTTGTPKILQINTSRFKWLCKRY